MFTTWFGMLRFADIGEIHFLGMFSGVTYSFFYWTIFTENIWFIGVLNWQANFDGSVFILIHFLWAISTFYAI